MSPERVTALLREIVEWDAGNWSRAMTFWEEHTTHDLSRVTALEIGSRHGGLSLWMALKGARVWCTDVGGPTPAARQKHVRHGVADRIAYGALDVLDIPYHQCFDVVLFKSVLGAVGSAGGRPAQCRALRQIFRSLKPGGELFFAENLRASPLHRVLRQRFVPWGGRWRYVSVAEMLEDLAPFSSVQHRTAGVLGLFGRTAWQRELLAALDRSAIERLAPRSWRYIIYGTAQKSSAGGDLPNDSH